MTILWIEVAPKVEMKKEVAVKWPESSPSLPEWLATQPTQDWEDTFHRDGCLTVNNILTEDEVRIYKDIYTRMLSGEIDTRRHRHDLGNHVKQVSINQENICQIMWPSEYIEDLLKGPLHTRAEAIAHVVLGKDCVLDFDMLISKGPHTNTETPWHQDESYWPDQPDKRAASFWVALDESTVDNGCMWFVPGSHKLPMRPFRPVSEGHHVLCCDCSEEEGAPRPLKPGSCTVHHGRTLHYSRGNTTNTQRRAYIVNFRPADMVKFERDHKFDHGKSGVDEIILTHKEVQ
ncbi:unnamed protein product [Owenia fusiformis]|uniref:Phytanoyl-CoA dioxygenase n=1 Tax=Owenia fusiformis TaxID=6347 RepID=A0A8S4NS58_OWEFU|nr:unnamed protein product [Owenia fusiformis]